MLIHQLAVLVTDEMNGIKSRKQINIDFPNDKPFKAYADNADELGAIIYQQAGLPLNAVLEKKNKKG